MIDARELRLTAAALILEAPTMPYRRDQLSLPTEARTEKPRAARAASAVPATQAATELVSADALYAAVSGGPAAAPVAASNAPAQHASEGASSSARFRRRAPLIIVPTIVGVIALFATWTLSTPPPRARQSPTQPAAVVVAPVEAKAPPPRREVVSQPPPTIRASATADRSPRSAVEALVAGKPDEAILAYRALSPAPDSSLGVVLRLLEAEAARRAQNQGER